MEKQVQLLNEYLMNLLKRQTKIQTKLGSTSIASTSFNGCQICKVDDHLIIECLKYTTSRPKCLKCGGLHRTENCGMRCSFCGGLGHIKECCWKKKDPKIGAVTMNCLKVMISDEEIVKCQLDQICAKKHDLFFHTKVPRRRLHVDTHYKKSWLFRRLTWQKCPH